MAKLSTLFNAGGGTLYQQEFTTSGTWVRPEGVGLIFVTAVGGGGGAATSTPGGYGAVIHKFPMTVNGNVSVIIGGLGASNLSGVYGDSGGSTIVNGFSVPGGGGGNYWMGGAANPGILDCDGYQNGYTYYYIHYVGTYGSSMGKRPIQKANGVFVADGNDYPGRGANTWGTAGNPGYCLIEWFA